MASLHATFGSPMEAFPFDYIRRQIRYGCVDDPRCRIVQIGGREWVFTHGHRLDDYVEVTGADA